MVANHPAPASRSSTRDASFLSRTIRIHALNYLTQASLLTARLYKVPNKTLQSLLQAQCCILRGGESDHLWYRLGDVTRKQIWDDLNLISVRTFGRNPYRCPRVYQHIAACLPRAQRPCQSTQRAGASGDAPAHPCRTKREALDGKRKTLEKQTPSLCSCPRGTASRRCSHRNRYNNMQSTTTRLLLALQEHKAHGYRHSVPCGSPVTSLAKHDRES